MSDPSQSNEDRPKSRWRRVLLATLIGGSFAGVGATIYAHAIPHGFGGGHCGLGVSDPETAMRCVESMTRVALSQINASEAQQTKIAGIVRTTMSDLQPLRDKHFEAHGASAALLSQPSIDRAALESLRAEQMQLAESASRRIVQALAEAAEVLTPEQRGALIERVQRMRAAHHRTPL